MHFLAKTSQLLGALAGREGVPLRGGLLLAALGVGLLSGTFLRAEPPVESAEPFDTIVLKQGTELRVELLPLPTRRGFRLPTSGRVQAVARNAAAEQLTIEWSAVGRLVLFEDRLLESAASALGEQDFGKTFRLLVRLEQLDAAWPGLEVGFQRLLRAEALARFRKGQYDHALALLQTLHERSPSASGTANAVDAVGSQMLEALWTAEDYRGMRTTIDVLNTQFPGLKLRTPKVWEQRLLVAQQALFDQAEAALAAGEFWAAREKALGAAALLPLGERGERLLSQIQGATPAVRIGVFVPAPWKAAPPRRVDRPASRRLGRLRSDALVWLDDYRGQGGVYGSPLGKVIAADDRRSVSLLIDPLILQTEADAAYLVARELLTITADPPAAFAPLAELLKTVRVVAPGTVELGLKVPHLNPPSLLLGPLPQSLEGIAPQGWKLNKKTRDETVYESQTKRPTGFSYFAEKRYSTDTDAVRDLLAGDLDVLADVPPWRIAALRKSEAVAVGRYRTPTLHCLVVGPKSRLAVERDTRRALSYLVPRDYFVEELLLGGRSESGFGPISGPFPYGLTLSDPLRYAYQDSISPQAHEPRLAGLLLALAAKLQREAQGSAQVEADTDTDTDTEAEAEAEADAEEEDPAPLVLIYPPSPVARLACQTIAEQFSAIGSTVVLREIVDEIELTTTTDYDLRYAEIRVDEPMTQAWEVLGPGGVAGDCSSALLAALERVPRASSGQQLSEAMADIFQIAYGDLQVIPLWQTVDHFAWRKSLAGLPDETVDLYQTFADWQNQSRRGKP